MGGVTAEEVGRPHPGRRQLVLAGAVLLAGYGWLLLRHTAFSVGGSDSSGYINTARRLLEGSLVERIRALDTFGLSDKFGQIFIPLGFLAGPKPGTMAPLYPAGFPLHMAAAALLGGWNTGPFLVSPLAAFLCLPLLYRLGRELDLPPVWCMAGAAMFAIWPVFLGQAIQPMSDVPATFWSMAAVLFALRSRRRAAWAVAAGAAFGIAVLVRPTNLLLLGPLLLALPLRLSVIAMFVAGGLPFAAIFVGYNVICYGGSLHSGYGKSGLWDAMALRHFSPRIRHYTAWIMRTLSPLPLLAWSGLILDRKVPSKNRLLLFVWFGVFLLFYCFYEPYDSFWFVRFLLPGSPAVILGALLVTRDLVEAGRISDIPRFGWRRAIASVLFLIVIRLEVRSISATGILGTAKYESTYPQASAWASRRLPEKSVVVAMATSGALEYYTRLTYARWDWVSPEEFRLLRPRLEGLGYRWFGLLFPFEADELPKHMPGCWKKLDTLRTISIWELAPEQPPAGRTTENPSKQSNPRDVPPTG